MLLRPLVSSVLIEAKRVSYARQAQGVEGASRAVAARIEALRRTPRSRRSAAGVASLEAVASPEGPDAERLDKPDIAMLFGQTEEKFQRACDNRASFAAASFTRWSLFGDSRRKQFEDNGEGNSATAGCQNYGNRGTGYSIRARLLPYR